jgi:hypothetical protein
LNVIKLIERDVGFFCIKKIGLEISGNFFMMAKKVFLMKLLGRSTSFTKIFVSE